MTDPAPTLPEELLLLALDPVRGGPHCRGRSLEYGVAGAALAELELQGRIAEEHGRVVVVNPLDPPDPLLGVFLRSLPPPGKRGSGSRVSAGRWVRQAGRQAEELYLDALVEQGTLLRETRRFIGLFPYRRHPAGRLGRSPARSGRPRRCTATCGRTGPPGRAAVRAVAVAVAVAVATTEACRGSPEPGQRSTTRRSCTRAGGLDRVVGGYAGRTRETPSYGSTDEHRTRGPRAAVGGSARGRLDRR
ncbi:GPP34 family phosphoprotein [Streptomyces sp. NPDC049970]|uniref:GOLPH3/VPS74 family protein n=1 Tax=Streptomyces sp. NPDC049970 TaxID=3155033 RepID=UPI003446C75C